MATRYGVTGHQRLEDPAGWTWAQDRILIELQRRPGPIVGVTSLAVGADQLFARLVLQVGGTIHAVLPYSNIERSFSSEDLPGYVDLVQRAAKTEILKTIGTDEDAYLAAG